MKPSNTNLIFLTGSTGLLGAHMLLHLLQSGNKVRCLIRKSSNFNQVKLVCSFYDRPFAEVKDSVEWVHGDTLDFVGLLDTMQGVEEVYHCAAIVSFNAADRDKTFKTNILGTANMVDAALEVGVKRFCFISSIAALGKTSDQSPINEDTPRKNDEWNSVYSESKYRSELEVWRGVAEGLNAVVVNPGIILGPGLLDKGSMLLIKTGMKGMPFYTNATTGYVDVRDVCRGAVELVEAEKFGQRFVFVSQNTSNKELFSWVAEAFGKRPPKYEATPFILKMGAFASLLLGRITGKTSQLTKETVRSAQKSEVYSHSKLIQAINFEFIPLKQTIDDICNFIKKHKLND